MSRLELVMDDRFEQLAAQLRAARPAAPDSLRERVGALAEAERRPARWSPRLPSRRVVLAVAAAALVASFVAAGITGLNGPERHSPPAASRSSGTGVTVQHGGSIGKQRWTPPLPASASPTAERALVAPSPGRLQRYDATLRLRVADVDALSNATKRAMSLTRALGGYVGAVDYSTRGGKRGGATLVLRVPVAKVETALTELASFGTILQQRASILDVTRRAERESKQIARLQRELETADPARAAEIRARLKTLRAKHARLVRSAHFARISLTLNTAPQAAAAPGRLDRTLDDAGAVLVRELEILLYALVVAGPLLLLGAAGVATARTARRRADRRLLERA